MFVAAGSAVAVALGFFMLMYYGDPRTTFLGDVDQLYGRDAGAAFLLLPTLVAVAALYGRAKDEGESGYRSILWTTVALAVLLLAGVRTGVPAWRYALGVGLAVAIWLMVPRLRLAAVALVLFVGLAVAHREVQQRVAAMDYTNGARAMREAVLDRADWAVVRRSSPLRLLAGNGVGTFFMALDRERKPWTYAVSRGDEVVGRARRQLTEVVFERGAAGIALALAAGLACVAAGALAHRRARDGLDAALGAGLAAATVALGVFACFSNGAVGFGSGMMFWIGLGLLGSLSIECGRPAGLATSPEEESWRDEFQRRAKPRKLAAAMACGLVVVVAWCGLAARPFWAEYCLREAQAEDETCRSLFAQKKLAEGTLERVQAGAQREEGKLRTRSDAVRAATAACEAAVKGGEDGSKLKAVEAKKREAEAALAKQRAEAPKKKADFEAAALQAEEGLRSAAEEFEVCARRADAYTRRAAALSLGDRVWLSAQVQRALSDAAREEFAAAADRYERLDALCGPAFEFDARRAACYAKLGRPADAHELYKQYAQKNPFGAQCTLFTPRFPFYESWFVLIADERLKKSPNAHAWGIDFVAAADEGIKLCPDHYGLRLLRGEMLYRLGDKARSRDDMMAAAAVIDRALRDTDIPFLRANLLFERANANIHWDKEKALKDARQVFLERIDPRDPQNRDVLLKARQIILRLEPPKEKPPRAPETKGAPPPKAKPDAAPSGIPKEP